MLHCIPLCLITKEVSHFCTATEAEQLQKPEFVCVCNTLVTYNIATLALVAPPYKSQLHVAIDCVQLQLWREKKKKKSFLYNHYCTKSAWNVQPKSSETVSVSCVLLVWDLVHEDSMLMVLTFKAAIFLEVRFASLSCHA